MLLRKIFLLILMFLICMGIVTTNCGCMLRHPVYIPVTAESKPALLTDEPKYPTSKLKREMKPEIIAKAWAKSLHMCIQDDRDTRRLYESL